jgi:hypothetical protein
MFVLMISLHSLLEYPLWYAYFLLPAAWAFGFGLGAPRAPAAAPTAKAVAAGAGGGSAGCWPRMRSGTTRA